MTGKKATSDDDTSVRLFYCTRHNFGAVAKDSIRYKEHIKESKRRCRWEKYDPIKHNPKYESAFVTTDQDEEEKLTPTQKLLNFAESQIIRTVRSFSSHSSVYGIIRINEKYRVLFLDSTECRQWLMSEYRKQTGNVHGKDLYKNVLSMIIAESITNQIPLEKIYNRICFVDDEIFYNLCNDDYEIVKITKDGYSTIQNSLDNPLFRRKSSPLPQTKPQKSKNHKNPLNELAELLKIPLEYRQLFLVHATSFFFEKVPIPIMIWQGEAGSSKSTITSTVKKIVDPSPENRNSMPDNIDDANTHFFNRYLTNFDNISFLDNMMSDNLCKAITGHTHNKRELWTDDGEVILIIKARIILNGVTLNVDQTDLISRSIFYESKHIPESEQLTESVLNKKIDELLPYVLDQIFSILSKVLKNYHSLEPQINQKQRMADFTVIGECISRELGYDNDSFIKSYKNNLSLHSFSTVESYPIIKIILEIAKERGHDFEISVSELYKKITSFAYENGINIKSKTSRFPQTEKAVSNQIVRLQSSFRSSGYEITSKRDFSRNSKYERGTRVFRIRFIGTNNTDDTSTLFDYDSKDVPPVSVVPVCQGDNQAQNTPKTDTISEDRDCVTVPDKNITNQTKNNAKNTSDTEHDTKSTVPKSVKSMPKNTTDTVTQLTQAQSDFDADVKNDKNTKRYSHFRCKTCNAGEFLIHSKDILEFHKKQGHAIFYFTKEGESS